MSPILALWAIPRSTSTPFEWMMRQRGDFTCHHEPFGVAWYWGSDARAPAGKADPGRIEGLSMASVKDMLWAQAETGPVFSKDFAHYISHMADEAFLRQFRHSFLIRDPAKVLPSFLRADPTFDEAEVGFDAQRALFDRLCDRDGSPPPLIDSDDLFEDPYAMVEAYCHGVGIEFIPEALRWDPPGDSVQMSWYEGGTWQTTLRASTGLHAKPRQPADPDQLPEALKGMYDRALPHYAAMYAHRITL